MIRNFYTSIFAVLVSVILISCGGGSSGSSNSSFSSTKSFGAKTFTCSSSAADTSCTSDSTCTASCSCTSGCSTPSAAITASCVAPTASTLTASAAGCVGAPPGGTQTFVCSGARVYALTGTGHTSAAVIAGASLSAVTLNLGGITIRC